MNTLPSGVSSIPLLPLRRCASMSSQWIRRNIGCLDQALLAARLNGDDERGPARRALGIESFQEIEAHASPPCPPPIPASQSTFST